MIGDVLYINIRIFNSSDTPQSKKQLHELLPRFETLCLAPVDSDGKTFQKWKTFVVPSIINREIEENTTVLPNEFFDVSIAYGIPESSFNMDKLKQFPMWREIQGSKQGTEILLSLEKDKASFHSLGKVTIHSRDEKEFQSLHHLWQKITILEQISKSNTVITKSILNCESCISKGTLKNRIHSLRTFHEVIESQNINVQVQLIQDYVAWVNSLNHLERMSLSGGMFKMLEECYFFDCIYERKGYGRFTSKEPLSQRLFDLMVDVLLPCFIEGDELIRKRHQIKEFVIEKNINLVEQRL
jgi:hypothetical protein